MDTDLRLPDIEFLRAVKDINANPDSYPKIDDHDAAMPATKAVIVSGSDLSRSEVSYRLDQESRLLENDLIHIHEAEFDPEARMFGAKSVELTAAGEDVLAEIDRESGGQVSGDELRQLRNRIDRLENDSGGGSVGNGEVAELAERVESLEASVSAIESKADSLAARLDSVENTEWGAISDEKVKSLSGVITHTGAMMYLFNDLFSVDVVQVGNEGEYTDEELGAAKRRLLQELVRGSDVDLEALAEGVSGVEERSDTTQAVPDPRPSTSTSDVEQTTGGSEPSDVRPD